MKTKSDEEEGERQRQRRGESRSNRDNKGRMGRVIIEGVPSEGEAKLDRMSRTLECLTAQNSFCESMQWFSQNQCVTVARESAGCQACICSCWHVVWNAVPWALIFTHGNCCLTCVTFMCMFFLCVCVQFLRLIKRHFIDCSSSFPFKENLVFERKCRC